MQKCPSCGTQNLEENKHCHNCGINMTSATGQLSPETVLENRYVIVGTLGRGGMGAVYKALDQRLNNIPVAIKEMSTTAVGQDNLQAAIGAFKKEASMLISLKHPSLPHITDFFARGEDRWYLVMDYIEGETLEEVIKKRGPVPEPEVLNWTKQLCIILDYLHNQKPPVIFRDLKPANIMLTPEGVIKLVDFGIARHFRPGIASDTSAYGSSGYAPPEQYGGYQTDARSDIYALGATLHHLLTGIDPCKNPFSFEPPSKIVRVTLELEHAIMKAVELSPEKRTSSVREILSLIDNIIQTSKTETLHTSQQVGKKLDGLPSSSVTCPLGHGESGKSINNKNPIWIIALIGILLFVGAGGWYVSTHNKGGTIVNNESKSSEETQQPKGDKEIKPDTQNTGQLQPTQQATQQQPPQKLQTTQQTTMQQPPQQLIYNTKNDYPGYLVIGTCSHDQQAVLKEMEQRNRSGFQTYVIYSSDWSNLAPGWYALIYGNCKDVKTANAVANDVRSRGIDVYIKHSGQHK